MQLFLINWHFIITMSLIFSTSVNADSWTITQSVDLSSHTVITQENTSGSSQAFNTINLDPATGVVVQSTQSLALGGSNLTLNQNNATSSKQGVNVISAANVVNGNQTLAGTGAVTLAQDGGTDNVQAVNAVITSGSSVQIESLTQSVTANSFAFQHTGGGSANIQAGNYIEANSTSAIAGSLVQNFTVVGTLTYAQDGTNNVQAGNVLVKRSGYAGEAVQQNFNVSNVVATYSFTDGNDSIAAANYVTQE